MAADLRKIFANAWNQRLTPQQWGDNVLEYFTLDTTTSADDLSRMLCGNLENISLSNIGLIVLYLYELDFMLQQSAVGPAPSPLLLSYLCYAIKSSLVSGTRFFQALCEVANPSSPLQFAAFLDLVVEFAPAISSETPHAKAKGMINLRASTERGLGRRTLLNRSTEGLAKRSKGDSDSAGNTPIKSSLSSSQIFPSSLSSSLSTSQIFPSSLSSSLSSGELSSVMGDDSGGAAKKMQEDILSISQVCLSIAVMLVKGLEYSLSNPNPEGAEKTTGLFAQQIQQNMLTCVDALVILLSEYRTLGFLLIARKQGGGTALLPLSLPLTSLIHCRIVGFVLAEM